MTPLSVQKVWDFIPGKSNRTQCHQRPPTAAMFLRSCFVKEMDGSCHLLYTSTQHRKYNEDFFIFWIPVASFRTPNILRKNKRYKVSGRHHAIRPSKCTYHHALRKEMGHVYLLPPKPCCSGLVLLFD